jgi:hypothetical protein
MAGDFNMSASELLAGGKLLSRKLSAADQTAANELIWKGQLRDYNNWLAALPISKADQELVRIVDIMRRQLIAGHDIGKRLKSALVVYENRRQREHQKDVLRSGVDSVHKIRGRPKTVVTTDGPGAFEMAGELFTLSGSPLSAEQVKKIYYEKKKLPKKKKTRP